LYTSSKAYKEAGVAVEVVVADVVAATVVKLVDLRRRRVQKVGCRKNTACIEKKFSVPENRSSQFFWRENSNRNLLVGRNWRYSIDLIGQRAVQRERKNDVLGSILFIFLSPFF
jgi:hypothetical protein